MKLNHSESSLRICLAPLALLLLLAGCKADEGMLLPAALPDPPAKPLAADNNRMSSSDKVAMQAIKPNIQHIPVLKHKVGSTAVVAQVKLPSGELVLNADGLPLPRFIDMALGQVLNLDYEIDPVLRNRQDPVTLHVSRPVSAKRLMGMIESTLQLYRVGLIARDGVVQVVPIERLRSASPALKQIKEASGNNIQLGRVVEFVPLYYIESQEALQLARMFINASNGDEIHYMKALNALMLIARPASAQRFREAIGLIDRPALRGSHLRMLHPVYWRSGDLIKTVSKMLEAQGVPVVKRAKERNKGVYMFPIGVINAIMVISPQQKWLKAVMDTVSRLDVPEAAGSGKQVFVYFVKNSRADELGPVIGQVLGQSARQSAPSLTKGVVAGPLLAPPVQGLKGLSVIIDRKRNALLFVGATSAYKAVLPLLASLDRIPRQVMIEVTVAEVSLDASDQLGIEWQLNNVDNSSKLTGVLGTLGGLGGGGGGLTYALLNNAGALKAKLSALATDGRTKILSTPKILTMDGEQAKIQVGDQVPVITQEISQASAVGGAGNVAGLLRAFKYVDTGVILTIKPTINEGGMVRIELSQEVSEAGQAPAGGNPPIFKRNVSTKMVARSGQTIVIGGMIRHSVRKRNTKVPLLGDIPIIGSFFKSTSDSDVSTELIVMITPHVLSSSEDAEFISKAMRQELGWPTDEGK